MPSLLDTAYEVIEQLRVQVAMLEGREDSESAEHLLKVTRALGNATTTVERLGRQMQRVPALLEDPALRCQAVVRGWETLPPEWRHKARALIARLDEEDEDNVVTLEQILDEVG